MVSFLVLDITTKLTNYHVYANITTVKSKKTNMSETSATSNGFEIQNPREKLEASEFVDMLSEEFGIDGQNGAERLDQFKDLSNEGIAIMLEKINALVQGSNESLMKHDGAMKIGETETLHPADRYDVFSKLVDTIKQTPDDINPERVGDVLALGVVMLHPFHDGNGRTARLVGYMFRDEFGSGEDYEEDFAVLAEPRDEARKRGGFMIYGYTPKLPEGFNQSDPEEVSDFLTLLLTEEAEGSYYSSFEQAPLRKPEVSAAEEL